MGHHYEHVPGTRWDGRFKVGLPWTSLDFIPPVTDWRVKARCSIEVVSSVSGQFPVKFHTKWLLWNVQVHFDCAGSHKTVSGPEISVRQFRCKFPRKIALVKCSCAFRLRRLAQNGPPGFATSIFPVNFHTKWLLWNVHVHLPTELL